MCLHLLVVAVMAMPPPGKSAGINFDLLVYGGTPAGISAAIGAVRAAASMTDLGGNSSGDRPEAARGFRVALVESSPWIGGMMAGGLGCTDDVTPSTYGGLALEFVHLTAMHYGPRQPLPHCRVATAFEPHVATATFASMLAEAGVTVMVGLELVEVQRSGSTLTAVVVSDTSAPAPSPTSLLTATAFVDATYEGDLMAAAGVEFTVGREARSQFGEPFAGRRPLKPGASQYGFPTAVDPRVRPGSEDGKLLAMVWPGPVAPTGGGDDKVMSYNYRLCLTNATVAAGGARAEIEEPADYDPALFELGRRLMRAHPPKQLSPEVLKIYPVAGSFDGYKSDVNSAEWPTSTNLVGGSWGYPNGTKSARKAIIARHVSYTRGLLWFLKTDPNVPPKLRAEMATWAWCGDEFVDNGHFPTHLYVREGRRMVGAHVITQNDTAAVHVPGNASIAVAGYAFDVHPVEIVPTQTTSADGSGERATVEGCIGPRPPPFEIPYASITPKELRNLLVPTALSASHVAFAAIRLELTWMAIGQSAGVAATLAMSRGVSVQDVPLAALREHLEAAGQVLTVPPTDAP